MKLNIIQMITVSTIALIFSITMELFASDVLPQLFVPDGQLFIPTDTSLCFLN